LFIADEGDFICCRDTVGCGFLGIEDSDDSFSVREWKYFDFSAEDFHNVMIANILKVFFKLRVLYFFENFICIFFIYFFSLVLYFFGIEVFDRGY